LGDGVEEDIHFPASHVYEKSGTYVITVTAYQSDGLTDNETVKVTVPLQESQPSSSPSQPSSEAKPSSSGIWIWLALATVVFIIIIMSVWIIRIIIEKIEEEKLLKELLSK
jgi:PKD repeat protein